MITHSFDTASDPVITPQMVYGAQQRLVDTCIITFSRRIFEHVLATYPCERIADIHACNGGTPIYAFPHQGKRIAVYLSPIGAAVAGTCVEEANWLIGAEAFVMFGSAGCLNRDVTQGKIVVPTEAYRDEGMSYHYAPPSDYQPVPQAQRVAEILQSLPLPCVMGRVWTTDAIYRETRAQMAQRQAEGCLAVEMELAGVQAVCTHHGWRLYDFLITGDVLDDVAWDVGELGRANHDLAHFRYALAIASRV